jgi:TonB family protein
MTRLFTPPIALLLLALSAPAFGQQDLAAAKELYVAAKYEEALALLDRLRQGVPSPDSALAVEQYRAVCLLALNRKLEAERAIEAVADIDPFFQPAEDEAAPWVRAAFRDARRKVLPAALQRLYGRAKEAYDRKALPDAIAGFKRVLALLADPDLALDKGALADMRLVTQGFLDLSEAAAAPPKPAAEPAAPAASPPVDAAPPSSAPGKPPVASTTSKPPGTAPAETKDAPKIYDSTSPDVTPPLPLRRDVPTWGGPRPLPGAEVVVEVIVRENGSIESAVVRQSAGKYHDQLVAQAARNWRYRPATRAGQPVKYRLLVKVVLASPAAKEPVGPLPAES